MAVALSAVELTVGTSSLGFLTVGLVFAFFKPVPEPVSVKA